MKITTAHAAATMAPIAPVVRTSFNLEVVGGGGGGPEEHDDLVWRPKPSQLNSVRVSAHTEEHVADATAG